jgi:hypothetical protein
MKHCKKGLSSQVQYWEDSNINSHISYLPLASRLFQSFVGMKVHSESLEHNLLLMAFAKIPTTILSSNSGTKYAI